MMTDRNRQTGTYFHTKTKSVLRLVYIVNTEKAVYSIMF